jgi:bacterioferritin-associated ferredoxin
VIVCHCHQVTDQEIRSAIHSGAGSLEAIRATCSAGSGCGGCMDEIAMLLFRTRRVLPLVADLMRDELEAAS